MFDFDGLDDEEESEASPGDCPATDQKNDLGQIAAVNEEHSSAPDNSAKAAGAAAAEGGGGRGDAAGAGGPGSAASAPAAELLAGVDAATRRGAELLKAAQNRQLEQDGQAASPGPPATASTARADKKVYWKVVKTIDAGGIAVRGDGPRAPGGRLQLHSIVVEKERRGPELRYEAVTGKSWGPRSGWVKIESKGTKWMECLGMNSAEAIVESPLANAKQLKALILFDWDDTLCPTSWIEECPQLRDAFEGQVPRTGEVWEKLSEQARAVKELLAQAASLATVALVTLAERPWVAVSVRDFLPEAEGVEGLEVFYAREGAMVRGPPGACPLTAMKRRAMQNAMEAMIAKVGRGTTFESFISIGDSEVERRAAQDFGRECQNKGVVKYTKTVKLMEHPNVRQLTTQCRALNERLRELVNFPGHRQITSAELMRPR